MAKLLTPDQLRALPNGTKLKSLMGEIVVKGKDRIAIDDTRFGCTAYSLLSENVKSNKIMAKAKKKSSKSGKSNAGTAKLKKIVAEAKRIRKDSPSMKWTNAIKAAAKKVK